MELFGGGFTIMQQMVVDVTKEPFPRVVHDAVLGPVGVKHSTYEQPLPETMGPAAVPYEFDGTAVKEERTRIQRWRQRVYGRRRDDLAEYVVMEVQRSLAGRVEPRADAGHDGGGEC